MAVCYSCRQNGEQVLKKSKRFGAECEIAGIEQNLYMIKNLLKKRNTPLIEVKQHFGDVKNSIGFLEYMIWQEWSKSK